MGEMKNKFYTLALLLTFIFASGCQNSPSSTPASNTPQSTNSNTQIVVEVTLTPTITPTPLPAAAIVNGERILLSDFNEEYLRYQDAATRAGKEIDQKTSQAVVLENMIDTVLLAQGARSAGFTLTDEMYTERVSKLGSSDNLGQWIIDNHYSQESFSRLFGLEIEAGQMRDQILAAVPTSAEQVHARQITVQGKQRATDIYNQLEAGADFATLSWIYDPITGGELSWFPRNYLVLPQIEEAVFALEPGQYTQIIETDYGYQIVQVIEKELDRPLTQDALLAYQRKALADWVQSAKTASQLTIELP